MKAILKFELPEEINEFNLANNGSNYYNALWDIAQYYRTLLKYNDANLNNDQIKIIEENQKVFFHILDDNSVNIYEIE
jgi:hypothetical protein